MLACILLATALKVSQPEAPSRAPADKLTALLQQAALRNDAQALRSLLEREAADPDGIGANGYTALIVAANNGHLVAARVLCEHGASVDARGKAALTALHAAAGRGHSAMIDALCDRGASVNVATELGFTPLLYGARAGHAEAVRKLLAHGARLEATDGAGYTALHAAAANDRQEAAAALLDAGADTAARGLDGMAPLHLAARGGHAAVVELLLARGADPEVVSKERNRPLHECAAAAQLDVAKQLLAAGAAVGATNCFGVSPLHKAASAGAAALCRLLLLHGAPADSLDQSGESPLHVAAAARHDPAVLAVLLEALVEDEAGLRAARPALWRGTLHEAAWRGSVAALRLLLPPAQREAPLEAGLAEELSEAYAVAMERAPHSLKAAQYLLSRGARPTAGVQKLDDRDAAAETESVPTEGLSKEWAQKIATMPPLSRRLLVGNEPPSGVAAAALVYEACVDAPLSRYRAAQAALAGGDAGTVLRVGAVLDSAACALLRAALDANGTSTLDSVDQLHEHVLYPGGSAELEEMLGAAAVRALLELPERFARQQHSLATRPGGAAQQYRLFDCFVRRYSSASSDQLLTSFHADSAVLTVNVALTSDAATEGGRLLGVYDGAVHEITRGEGDATVHSSALLHGVTRMRNGTRYSMILFFANT